MLLCGKHTYSSGKYMSDLNWLCYNHAYLIKNKNLDLWPQVVCGSVSVPDVDDRLVHRRR